MAIRVDVWSDFVGPFCFLVASSLEKLEKQYDLVVHWRSFELRPAGSPPISPEYRARIEASSPVLQKRAREQYGLDINRGPFGIDSRPALIVQKYAESQGKGAVFHQAIMQAYWQQARSIGDKALLKEIAGPAVSGWFVGLPLTSGPITLYLALDQGTAFAARAAQGTLLGLISVASFCLAFSWLSLRAGWLGGLLAGWCVFFASTFVLDRFSVPLFIAFAGVIAFLAIVLKLFPTNHGRSSVVPPPQWEVLLRMVP